MAKTSASKAKQIDKFKAAARELGCDESEAVFDEKLKKIVPVKKGAEKQP